MLAHYIVSWLIVTFAVLTVRHNRGTNFMRIAPKFLEVTASGPKQQQWRQIRSTLSQLQAANAVGQKA